MRYIGMPFLRAQIMHAVYWYIAGIFRKLEVYWQSDIILVYRTPKMRYIGMESKFGQQT